MGRAGAIQSGQAHREHAERPFSARFRISRRSIVQLLAIASIFLLPAKSLAKEHPVPLEKNADTATCVTCHEDRSKGKFVHSAIQMGCTACHEVRVSKDVTRVKLTATSPTALCLTCHADKNAADLKGKVHPPAVRDCTACHDPHTSDNKFQLVKATSGGPGENLCLNCHSIGVKVSAEGSRHAALDLGCDTCHTTHKVGDPEKHEFAYHLVKDTPALCLDCHNAKDAALQKAHHGQPFGTTNCLTCHNPHESNQKHLLQAFTHMPFAMGTCDTCHKPAKDGKVVLVAADTRSLCLTCHEDKGKQIDNAKVQHPGAAGECTACHSPHAGKTPAFLQPDPVSACTTCHADIAEQHKKKFPHQPAFTQGCATCHEPHGSDHAKLLRAEGNALCLECHGPNPKAVPVKGEPYVTIFSGKVKLPADYFTKNSVPRLDIKYGQGHPVAGHPVEDVRDPSDQTKVRTKISCLTCHQPHAGAARAMLINDAKPGLQFCRNCHKGTPGEPQ